MAEQVNRALWATGFSLAVGQTQHWTEDGQVYGRVRWFNAFPLHLAGTGRAVEVERVFTRTFPDGVRRVEVIVRNVGTATANYAIWVTETTGP